MDYLGFQYWYYSQFFSNELRVENRNHVLAYLSSGKGCFPYELVTGFNSFASVPENGDFWLIEMFYSRLRDKRIFQKEWEECRKLFKLMKMRNLSNFNNIYNIQDVYILGVITECRWQKIKVDTDFNPRCLTSASTFSGETERVKSKIVIAFPKDIETVELMESLLSIGYSSVQTRVGFDTEMLTRTTKEYLA